MTRRSRLLPGLLLAGLCLLIAAAPAVRAQTTRVVVVSDLNESYGSTRYAPAVDEAVRRTIALKPDLVISTGDMVAAQRLSPPMTQGEVLAMWQAFDRHVTTPLADAGVPFAVTPGNHDASSGKRFTLERTLYQVQWTPRRPAVEFIDASDYPFNYAFRVREVLFISLDATHVGHIAPQRRAWLDALLQTWGPKFQHRVVFSHVPLWPFAVGRERDYLGDHALEAVLQRGKVGVVLSGHHHAYYPGYKDGVRFVSQGCLGAAPRPLLGSTQPSARSITLLELGPGGELRVDAFAGSGFDEPVARSSLPPHLQAHGTTIVRDDIALEGTPGALRAQPK